MYERLAQDILFGKVLVAELESKYDLTLRKGKTVEDIREAARKGMRAGRGKVEFELSMVEVYLKTVLKAAPKCRLVPGAKTVTVEDGRSV